MPTWYHVLISMILGLLMAYIAVLYDIKWIIAFSEFVVGRIRVLIYIGVGLWLLVPKN